MSENRSSRDDSDKRAYMSDLEHFLAQYEYDRPRQGVVECEHGTYLGRDQVCKVDLDQFGPCNRNNQYGYNRYGQNYIIFFNVVRNWRNFKFLTSR